MITLFDVSAAQRALPLGTGNKTERLFGYFTWHADDSPPVNPIGDLFKTQVWTLARHLGVPDVIVSKPASADLITGPDRRGRFRHQLPPRGRHSPLDPPGLQDAGDRGAGLHRARDRAGAETPGLHPLEAPAAHRRDAERDGDRGVLSEAGGLLEDGEEPLKSRPLRLLRPLRPMRSPKHAPRFPPHVATPSATSRRSSCPTCRTSAATCSAAS